MKSRNQLWLVSLMILIFLVLGIVHSRILLRAVETRLSDSHAERLNLLGRAVLPRLEARLPAIREDPYLVYKIANETGVARIAILDREGIVEADSQGRAQPGEPLGRIGMDLSELDQVWEGSPKMAAPYEDETQAMIRSLLLPVRGPEGKTVAIALFSIELPSVEEPPEAAVTSLLLKLFGAVLVFAVVYGLIRTMRASHRRPTEELSGPGAMIETFHDLVRKLKEKELELQKLKHQAEQRAEDVESYNENILQSVASGVITFDRSHRITTFNAAAERILGVPKQATVGRTGEDLFGKGSQIDRLLEEALDRETVISRQEVELHRPLMKIEQNPSHPLVVKGQDRIWVGVSTSLLRNSRGQTIGATFVFTDLTEIKYLQEQVELKRRLTVLGEMSAGIAHEFRNFMGSIMGYAKLISKRLESKDPRQSMVQAITRELQAMDRLIEQLLNFGRHTELNLAPVDLESFLHKQILHVLAMVADHARPKPRLEIPHGLPPVQMDEMLMRQALTNLLQNAIEAMPHGGELRISVKAQERENPAGETSREVAVTISDTGIGIPQDKLEKIFLPFFTTKEKGTGMGLALVHKIILSHNGRIEVQSAEGQGTTFYIYLPLK